MSSLSTSKRLYNRMDSNLDEVTAILLMINPFYNFQHSDFHFTSSFELFGLNAIDVESKSFLKYQCVSILDTWG
jgi:hypothetical protein